MLPLLLRAPGAGLAAAPAPACRRPKAASAPPPPSRRRAAAAPSPPRSAPTSPPADTSPPLPPPPPTWQAVPAGPLAEEHVRASQPGAGGVQPPAPGGRTLLLCVDPASPHPLRAVHWAAAKGLARPGDAAHLLSVLPIGAPARARTTHESAPSSRLTPGRVERTYEPSDFSPVSLNYGPKADPEMLRRAEEASRAVLGAACAALEKGGVYTVAHSLAERSWESVAAAVCAKADQLGADVVVVASSGKPWLQEALLGSVTRAVVAACAHPVLVLPPPKRVPPKHVGAP